MRHFIKTCSRNFVKIPKKVFTVTSLTDDLFAEIDLGAGGFKVQVDQPVMMGGTNMAGSPMAANLASLLGCENSTARFLANKMGIEIGQMNFVVTGELNMEGFMAGTRKSYWDKIEINVEVETCCSDEQLQELARATTLRCPVASFFKAMADLEGSDFVMVEEWKIVGAEDFQPKKVSVLKSFLNKMFKLVMK